MSALIALEEMRESLALDMEHAALLEGRHRDNEKAMAGLPTAGVDGGHALVCLGKEAFLSLGTAAARSALTKDNERLWMEIEEVQMRITKKGARVGGGRRGRAQHGYCTACE